ncbi:MAG: hypothetical protein CM1200mP24_04470 [Gammaproteobacteria bacterium]|nr:MAG: hypothetical protein CM1200mP24_04470 [Gammaproteobacteria bacterium]
MYWPTTTVNLCGALGGQTRRVAGVLKADGYGMGAVEVARRLSREGCRIFFSANVAEAMTLREAQIQEIIYVFFRTFI